MTLDKLVTMLEGIKENENGDLEIMAWDADERSYRPVTGAVYDYKSIQLQTDTDEFFVG